MIIRGPMLILAAVLVTATWIGHFYASHADTQKKSPGTAASVLEHHNGPRRDGVYVDPTLTKVSAETFHMDPAFHALVPGAIYAQLLFVAKGIQGKDVLIAATEEDNVAAFDADTGATLWSRTLGTPVLLSRLPCGNIDPLGITGTPVIDLASRTIFLDAMTLSDKGSTIKHLIFKTPHFRSFRR